MAQRLYSYLKDPYLDHLPARVVELGEHEGRPFVVLNDTIFYPEGGGQPADRGQLGDLSIVDVQRVDGQIRHFYEGPAPTLDVGLEAKLDWSRRFDHMQQHSGQHLLTAIADQLFGWDTTSFHLGLEVCDIELDTASVTQSQLDEIENHVADIVRQDRTISSRQVEPETLEGSDIRSRGLPPGHRGQVRIIDINGVDECACGGTHLRSTCELETLKLLGTESIRGGTRLFWVAGRRVLERLNRHELRNRQLREILGASDEELPQVAELKIEQQKKARRRIQWLEQQWAQAVAEALSSRTGPWVEAHFDETGAGALGQIARATVGQAPKLAVFLTGSDEKGAYFVLAKGQQSEADLSRLGPAVAEALDGRGGGKGPFYQGRAGSLDARNRAVAQLSLGEVSLGETGATPSGSS